MHNNYEQLYYDQLAERQMFKYPPYYRLIYVYLKHRKEDILDLAADTMAAQLRSGLGHQLESTLIAPEIREVQHRIRIQNPHHTDMIKVQSFGHHLRTNQDIGLALFKIRDNFLVCGSPPDVWGGAVVGG